MAKAAHIASVTARARPASPGKAGKISLAPRLRVLKLAVRELIEAVGGLDPASEYCRLGKSQLGRCQSFDEPDFLPLDVIERLEEVAGRAPVTIALARAQGLAVIGLPAAAATGDLLAALADKTAEVSEVSTGLLAALADGNCSAAEAEALVTRCTEAAEAVIRLRALLEQTAERG